MASAPILVVLGHLAVAAEPGPIARFGGDRWPLLEHSEFDLQTRESPGPLMSPRPAIALWTCQAS
ncbi:hypothetical protein SBI_09372 [Streptomyces bingchenggensis BCW-1]|uniref:Uncharacterized protein n=1 Tax=Streptomyces bingchenggensis (strain BCW-1) TaxID=749414 RepID=D7C5W1_STRBB|nr:hypothetical protein SBI_09372 [Streptomyces bingchenggensis BCW-1]